jgi:crotonobetainyl-CoA:carnitine CoA-transferase CaiB-like acyl-CoA transferase
VTLPLAGLRVVSVEQFGAAPFGTMYLADLGAEVIRIEAPDDGSGMPGDLARHTGEFRLGENDSHFYQTFNRNKRAITLDIGQPAGQEVLHRLAARADAVANNLRGDLPARFGLDHAALAAVRPGVVCVHISGYGRTGERAAWPAYDYLAQAEAGMMALTGEPEDPPTRLGVSLIDMLSGLTAAVGLLAAVFSARATGLGRDVDVSLYDVALHNLNYPATWYLNEAHAVPRRPRGGHPFAVPCERFPTADGHVFVMCMKPGFWRRFCAAVGRPDLAEEARFRGYAERLANRDALVSILDPLLAAQPTAYWVERLGGQVPVAPVLSLAAALDSPHFRGRGGAQPTPHPARDDFMLVANPIRLDGALLPGRAAPGYGADTAAVLAELGYDAAAIAALRDARVV